MTYRRALVTPRRIFRVAGCVAPIWVVALGLVLVGCRGGAPPIDFPPGAQVLHLAATDDVPTLDPAAGYDTASWSFEQMIFDMLVRYGDDDVTVVPDLALTWEVSSDATTFTFHLRHDATFTNGC
jgi:peptide/nickel transport system substrate-binding protein